MGFILRIVLIISLFFNVALYYGFMDIGQYRNYIDTTIEDVKEISNSDEFKNFTSLIQDKFKENYDENIGEIGAEEKFNEVRDKIVEVGTDKAKEEIANKYPKLSEVEVSQIVNAAKEVLENETETKK